MKRKVLCLVTLILSVAWGFSQTKKVSGTVKNPQGGAVPFASIVETGTANGVSGDANGNFSITISDTASITVSSSGFTSKTFQPA